MILRQLFDRASSSYTYIFADQSSKNACIIDPVKDNVQHYIQLCEDLNLHLVLALDTHVHADHITGLGKLRDITGCNTMVGSTGDVSCATEGLADGTTLKIGELSLHVIFTPGHTADSYCFYLTHATQSYIFTGDTLLIRGTGRTDFQNGNPSELYDSLHKKLLKLPLDTIVLPGHDYKGWTRSTLAEEKAHNPRLQLKTKEAFVEHMQNLKLPNPKLMDIAIPANLVCGQTHES